MDNNSQRNIKLINLSNSRKISWKEELPIKIKDLRKTCIEIYCKDLLLTCQDLKDLIKIVTKKELKINRIQSLIPETLVSASCLGLETKLILGKSQEKEEAASISNIEEEDVTKKTLFHEGTLRSGEQLIGEGDILLLGDVNPGARVEASGNILIWGRLRGIAHAGKEGNESSKIIALELRPLQLRIANAIARGPEENPEPGLAEEARLEKGKILIEPAKPPLLNRS